VAVPKKENGKYFKKYFGLRDCRNAWRLFDWYHGKRGAEGTAGGSGGSRERRR
jgi:hypothetical protein